MRIDQNKYMKNFSECPKCKQPWTSVQKRKLPGRPRTWQFLKCSCGYKVIVEGSERIIVLGRDCNDGIWEQIESGKL